MTVSIGDYVYSQHTTGADRDGVSWIYVERRAVLAIEGSAVTLSARETDKIPTHSAVEADIQWYANTKGSYRTRDAETTDTIHRPDNRAALVHYE